MSVDQRAQNFTWPAGADLSASQFCFVKFNSSNKVVLCGDGEMPIGVLQNEPAAVDRDAVVCVYGQTKMKFGGSVSTGRVASDSTGRAATPTTGEYQPGVVVEGVGAANRIGSILLLPTAKVL
jgi:hypothetical protein